jgi:hypothetical protein
MKAGVDSTTLASHGNVWKKESCLEQNLKNVFKFYSAGILFGFSISQKEDLEVGIKSERVSASKVRSSHPFPLVLQFLHSINTVTIRNNSKEYISLRSVPSAGDNFKLLLLFAASPLL